MTPASSWPPGRPRLLLTDAWLANAGDAAVAMGLERLVRAVAPTAAVLHASYQHDVVGPLLPELRVVPPLELLLGHEWAPPAPGWEDAGRELVAGADLVICQGGGFLVEAYQPYGRVAALAEVGRLGIPLALVGLTIEGFRRATARRGLRAVLRSASLVAVRDPESLAHAADLGAIGTVLGTDLALALFPDRPPADGGGRDGISVVLTDHHPVAARRDEQARLAEAVLHAVVAAGDGDAISIWSTVQGLPDAAREDDGSLAQRLVDALPRSAQDRITLAEGYVVPDRAVDLAGGARALVTMRLHPSLFAAGTGTPFALVLPGQRRGVWWGTQLAARLPDPTDASAVAAAIDRALGETAPAPQLWDQLAPMRARLDEMRDQLAGLVAGLRVA